MVAEKARAAAGADILSMANGLSLAAPNTILIVWTHSMTREISA